MNKNSTNIEMVKDKELIFLKLMDELYQNFHYKTKLLHHINIL